MYKAAKIVKVQWEIKKLEEEKERLEEEIQNGKSLISKIEKGSFYIDEDGVYRKGKKERVKNNRYNYDTELSNSMEKDIFNKLKKVYCSLQRRHNDKKRKGDFITFEAFLLQYLKQNGLCYYTNLSFSQVGSKSPLSMSVDRIDSSIGYTLENTVFCCWFVNCAKNAWTIQDMLPYWKLLTNLNPNNFQ